MALTDPLSITLDTVVIPLPRVSTGEGKSEYLSSEGLTRFSVNHNYGKRIRRAIRLDHSKYAIPPGGTEQALQSTSMYLVIDEPQQGFSNADLLGYWQAYKTMLAATSDSLVSKVLGGES